MHTHARGPTPGITKRAGADAVFAAAGAIAEQRVGDVRYGGLFAVTLLALWDNPGFRHHLLCFVVAVWEAYVDEQVPAQADDEGPVGNHGDLEAIVALLRADALAYLKETIVQAAAPLPDDR